MIGGGNLVGCKPPLQNTAWKTTRSKNQPTFQVGSRFMIFLGIAQPEELRRVARAHVLAWSKYSGTPERLGVLIDCDRDFCSVWRSSGLI
jgi:hypothetical protein